MSEQMQGTVGWTGSKAWQDKVFYSFKIDGVEDFFRTGTDNPNVTKGDVVSFGYVNKANKQGVINKEVQAATINKVAVASNPAAGATPSPSGTTKAVGKDDYWGRKEATDEVRQKIIAYQASRNASIEMINAALVAGILPLGSGAKDAKFDLYKEMVWKLTQELFADTHSPHVLEEPADDPYADTAEDTTGGSLDD